MKASNAALPMPQPVQLGIEATRSRLPERVDAASRGDATIVSRHGKPVAALVPIAAWQALQDALNRSRPAGAIAALTGIAAGMALWGDDPARAVDAGRNEW